LQHLGKESPNLAIRMPTGQFRKPATLSGLDHLVDESA
jgi:hypothetical protein